MRLILVTGGARSGKSDYAQRRAAELGRGAVTYIATATTDDEEMAARIARHRAARPGAWHTIEAPRGAAAALRTAPTAVVVLDCLTLLASNALLAAVGDEAGRDGGEDEAHAAVTAEVNALLAAAAERSGTLVVVTNEVGLGVVPSTAPGRWFRDALGTANCRLAAAADEVVLLVSGVPLRVKGPPHPPSPASP